MVLGLAAGSIKKSRGGNGGASKSPADSKNVVFGGASRSSAPAELFVYSDEPRTTPGLASSGELEPSVLMLSSLPPITSFIVWPRTYGLTFFGG